MQIFDHEGQRLDVCLGGQPADQPVHETASLLLGRHEQRCEPVAYRQFEQVGDESGAFARIVCHVSKGGLDIGHPLAGGHRCGPVELLLDQMLHDSEGLQMLEPGGCHLHPCPAALDLGSKLLQQGGLPDSRLSEHEHDLTMARRHRLPAVLEERHLGSSPDEGSIRPVGSSPGGRNVGNHAVHHNRLRHPFQVLRSERLVCERPLEAAFELVGHHNPIGLCNSLHPGRHIHRIAERVRLAPLGSSDLRHDHEPRVQSHPCRDSGPAGGAVWAQVANRPQDLESSQDRVLSRGLARLGVPEERKDAVAQVLRHEPVEPADDVTANLVVGIHQLAEHLRVELRSELRGADEIAEHRREPSTLASSGNFRGQHVSVCAVDVGVRALRSARFCEHVGCTDTARRAERGSLQ